MASQAKDESLFTPVPQLLDAFQNAKMIVIYDDSGSSARGSAGYLATPAQMITPAKVNFMAKEGRGLICLALTRQRADQLGLTLMPRSSGDRSEAAFTVSIEARDGVTTGISAADRARTIAVAVDGTHSADAIVTPGHVFPVVARDGGVLTFPGSVEAAVDLARITGLNPSAVLCQILDQEGEPASFEFLVELCRKHDLKCVSLRQLVAYRMANDNLIEIGAKAEIASLNRAWRARAVRNCVTGQEALVLKLMSDGRPTTPPLIEHCEFNPVRDLVQGLWQPESRLAKAIERVELAGAGAVIVTFTSIFACFADDETYQNDRTSKQAFIDQIRTQLMLNLS